MLAVDKAVRLVALLNLGYFGIEFAIARSIGSVSLFADSIDFLEDAAVNGVILVALGWSAQRRSIVGMILAAILFVPAVATAWTAWKRFKYSSTTSRDPALDHRIGSTRCKPVLCDAPRSLPCS